MAGLGPPPKKKRTTSAGIAAAARELPGSRLRVWLLEQFAWGLLSPQQVQAISAAALHDARERTVTDLEPLAKLGSSGQHSNNVNRDLMRLVGQEPLMYNPSRTTLRKNASEVPVPVDGVPSDEHAYTISLPHELFSSLYHNYKAAWKQVIMPGQAFLDRFWKSARGLPQWEGHPLASEPSHQVRKIIPLSLHGDETPVLAKGKIWSSSALVMSWASLLGSGSTKQSQLYIWAAWHKSFSKETNDDLWSLLLWSFEALWSGVFPKKDWRGYDFDPHSPEGQRAGQYLADGYRAVLVASCGDLDYMAQFQGLPRWNSNSPCCLCQCQKKGDRSWHCFAEDAAWRTTLWTPAAWKAWPSRSMNRMFQKDLCSVLVVHFDLMHCRYLGYLQQLYGSVFWVLCEETMQGSPSDNLHELWGFLKTYQSTHKVHSPYSQRLNKVSMYKKKTDFPKLRGKAAEIKDMAAAVRAMWGHFGVPGQDFQEIGLLLDLTCKFEEILEEWPIADGYFCLPAEAADRLKTNFRDFACLYVMVGDRFRSEDRRAFNPTEKMHACEHIVMLSHLIHPGLTSCWRGEDRNEWSPAL
ncbi:unnamed protein product [Symbiodinium sp. CCMP2592]|nr:unnamed protein product [Symbiodinium sp. CCMP2592]